MQSSISNHKKRASSFRFDPKGVHRQQNASLDRQMYHNNND